LHGYHIRDHSLYAHNGVFLMKQLKGIILLLSLILAFFSFAISYTTMRNLAIDNNVEPAFLFPLIIDGVILLTLVYRLYGQDIDTARIIMAGYVIASIGFNAVAHGNPLSAIMAAVAPISMLVTSEICASMLNAKDVKSQKRDEKGRFAKKDGV